MSSMPLGLGSFFNFPVIQSDVPNEIASHIFLLVCSDHDLHSVLCLTQVSRQWRHVAHTSPELWCHFNISICDEIPPGHANMVHSWLSRSGDLDIHILISSAVADPNLVYPVIPFAEQIKTLRFESPVACLLPFTSLPPGISFPRLTSFQSMTWGHPNDSLVRHSSGNSEWKLLNSTPELVSLSVRHKSYPDDSEDGPWLFLRSRMIGWPNWAQITHLDLRETELDIEVIFELLVQCKALIIFSAYTPHRKADQDALSEPLHVLHVLEHLKYFSLSATYWDEATSGRFIECNNLFRSIRFTNLDTLELNRVLNPIPALSSQAYPLRSLTLTESLRGCTSADLCLFLQDCTVLEELKVSSCHESAHWFDNDFVHVLTYRPLSKSLPLLNKIELKIRLDTPRDPIALSLRKLLHLEVARMVDSRWRSSPELVVRQWSLVSLCFIREPEWFLHTLTEDWYKELMAKGLKMTVEYGLVSVTSVIEQYLELEDLPGEGDI